MSSSDSLSGELNSFPTSQEFLNNVVISEPAIEAALKVYLLLDAGASLQPTYSPGTVTCYCHDGLASLRL